MVQLWPSHQCSSSHAFKHEFRREVSLQVMHRFGQVDDADEWWKMGVENMVRQTILCLTLTIVSSWYLLHLQSDPIIISEGGVQGVLRNPLS